MFFIQLDTTTYNNEETITQHRHEYTRIVVSFVYATSRVRVPGDVQAIGRHHLTMDGIERYGI
jgi:hypothetical protein